MRGRIHYEGKHKAHREKERDRETRDKTGKEESKRRSRLNERKRAKAYLVFMEKLSQIEFQPPLPAL